MWVYKQPDTESGSEFSSQGRVLLFLVFILFVSVQRDGFWRLSLVPEHKGLLELSALLVLVLLQFVFSERVSGWLGKRLFPSRTPVFRAVTLVAAVMQAASGVLFMLSAQYYRSLGYLFFPRPTLLVFGFASVLLVTFAVWPRPVAARTLLTGIMVIVASVFALTIASFPVVVGRSDMLPLISAAGSSLLAGQNPYHFYGYPLNNLFLTYLPGTWLAYFPAILLHLDLRWVTLFCECLVMFVVYRSVRRENRLAATSLLAVFFCSPFLQYRHEIYTAPHWLILTASLLLGFRKRVWWSGVLMGVSLAMSQFSWVVFPFYLLFWLQSYGWRKALCAAMASIAGAFVIAGPFILWSPKALIFGVLGHWQTVGMNARPANLSYGVAGLVGRGHLQLVQAAVIIALLLFCVMTRSCSTTVGAMRWITTAVLLFVLLNFIVWGYFFLLVLLLTLVGTLAANDWLTQENDELDKRLPA